MSLSPGFPKPPLSSGQYPNQRSLTSPPTLPPMASLLHQNTPRHDPQSLDHSRYQISPSYAPNHQLWHSASSPEAPPPRTYQPPQHQKIHTQAAPSSVVRPLRMAVPRHDSMSAQSDTSSRSTSSSQMSRAMPISGLLSTDPSPLRLFPRPRYTIRLRQQPMAARACGFGERDRRVIDPPPILQMMIESPSSTGEEISAMIRSNLSVVHCTLWDPVTDKDDTAMPGTTDRRQQRRLMGTLVSSPFVGLDEHDVEGCFFTFPDLSVRTPGTYSLKFCLVILDPTNMRPGGSAAVQSTAMSVPFHVYNAKDFSGMRASTALTKKLKNQGCLISVKKGNAKSTGHERDDDDDDDDEDDDEAGTSDSKGKKGKRAKR